MGGQAFRAEIHADSPHCVARRQNVGHFDLCVGDSELPFDAVGGPDKSRPSASTQESAGRRACTRECPCQLIWTQQAGRREPQRLAPMPWVTRALCNVYVLQRKRKVYRISDHFFEATMLVVGSGSPPETQSGWVIDGTIDAMSARCFGPPPL